MRVDRDAVIGPAQWRHDRTVRKMRRGLFCGGSARQASEHMRTLPGPRNGAPHRLQRCSLAPINRALASESELFIVRASSVGRASAWLRHGRS